MNGLECRGCGNREPEVLIGGWCERCLTDDYGDARARLLGNDGPPEGFERVIESTERGVYDRRPSPRLEPERSKQVVPKIGKPETDASRDKQQVHGEVPPLPPILAQGRPPCYPPTFEEYCGARVPLP
jgi:hypothetical protein